ncbi:hypothetical protein PEL8287_02858 [Roseovarius litorisediminis]|uniref:Roadblock/LAMTOR2 domain-containing protein n=1 Tax=Roseovarius litorisediminis TaxID=1312363 RepID=A0A1Y5T1I7_9RHOB|nr:hypothetical protein [Roseovarius litorisediminis]SLN53771.1 hypothetical protein PEL8287_02858 [Roseovarius litorisediminis]
MTIDEELDALRKSALGCSLVAFGDARTRLVLRSSHEKAYHREYLDELCIQAANCFELLDAASQADNDSVQERSCEAVVLTASNIRMFVRAEDGGPDFLCCVCDFPCISEKLMTTAHKTLGRIADSC